MWYEASDTGKHCKSREIHNLMDVHLQRLPPHNFSHQKFDLAWKIQHRRLWSLGAAATSSKRWKYFRIAFPFVKKVEINTLHRKKMTLSHVPGLTTFNDKTFWKSFCCSCPDCLIKYLILTSRLLFCILHDQFQTMNSVKHCATLSPRS